jgi:acyl-CoA thioesterase-2
VRLVAGASLGARVLPFRGLRSGRVRSSAVAPPVPTIADHLALERVGGDRFRATPQGEGRVFGGLLVAQSLWAAHSTLDGDADRPAHSLHGTFVRAGRNAAPLRYDVERIHDGGSFSTRRVVVTQDGEVVFLATARFHADEAGSEYEPPADPVGALPEELPVGRYDSPWFESRDCPPDEPGHPVHARSAWFRARASLPDDPVLHQHALAFVTDHGATRAVREPHKDHPGVERRQSVSLDHSVWFHRPARVDDWLLFQLVPMATIGGRGLALGTVRASDGLLVATVAQEAMLRLPD